MLSGADRERVSLPSFSSSGDAKERPCCCCCCGWLFLRRKGRSAGFPTATSVLLSDGSGNTLTGSGRDLRLDEATDSALLAVVAPMVPDSGKGAIAGNVVSGSLCASHLLLVCL